MEPLHVRHVLLVLCAQAGARLPQPVALARYLMLMRQVAFGTDRLLAQLVHTSIHLPQLLVHIVLLVQQATRALVAQLLQLLVLPVKL